MSVITNFSTHSTCFSEMIAPQHTIDFQKDLVFIRKTLLEDHPAVYNDLDTEFLNTLEKGYETAQQKLSSTGAREMGAEILQELARSFYDAHLWIRYDFAIKEAASAPCKAPLFAVEEIAQDVFWVSIPTFYPSADEEVKNLRTIIDALSDFTTQTILLDLRGNGGGNSSWGEEILNALFGKEYAYHQLSALNSSVFAQWRVSSGNVEHVQNLTASIQKQFGESHPTTKWIQKINSGMKNAYLCKENYYTEPEDSELPLPSSEVTNTFDGKMYVIIDKHCGSACLDFIDGLKAMHIPITFIGQTTGADSLYMELKEVSLPSGKGTLGLPIKVYRNRPRGHNKPHTPDVPYPFDLENTVELKRFILSNLLS